MELGGRVTDVRLSHLVDDNRLLPSHLPCDLYETPGIVYPLHIHGDHLGPLVLRQVSQQFRKVNIATVSQPYNLVEAHVFLQGHESHHVGHAATLAHQADSTLLHIREFWSKRSVKPCL